MHGAQVARRDSQHISPWEVVGHPNSLVGVLDHPGDGGDDRAGDLQRGRALVGDDGSGLVDRQQRAGPPGTVGVAHQQDPELVATADDLVVEDPLSGLHGPVAHPQFDDAADRHVGRAVRVVNRRSVDRVAVIAPHGQVVADGQGFAVADDHAVDLTRGNPRPHPGLHARAGDADLVARPEAVVNVSVWWQPLLVGAPSELCGSDAFFVEAVDRPGVDELVDLFGEVGDLRISLGDVHHPCAGEHRQRVVRLIGQRTLERIDVGSDAIAQHASGDLGECLFGEVADQAGVGAVLEHGSRAAVVAPPGDHPAQIHVPGVQRAVERRRRGQVVVRVPHLDTRVEVPHAVVAAPLQDGRIVDVPCQIEQQIARPDPGREERVDVVRRDLILLVVDAEGDRIGHPGAVVDHVDDRDSLRVDRQIADQQRHRALGNRATAEHQHPGWTPHGVHGYSAYSGDIAASSRSSVAASADTSSDCQSYAIPLRPDVVVPSNTSMTCASSKTCGGEIGSFLAGLSGAGGRTLTALAADIYYLSHQPVFLLGGSVRLTDCAAEWTMIGIAFSVS